MIVIDIFNFVVYFILATFLGGYINGFLKKIKLREAYQQEI